MTAAIAAIVAGISSTGILIVISRALTKADAPGQFLAWSFLGLCLFVPLSRFVSQVLLVRLSQAAMFDLRMQLSCRILGTPLRQLMRGHRIVDARNLLEPHKVRAAGFDYVGMGRPLA